MKRSRNELIKQKGHIWDDINTLFWFFVGFYGFFFNVFFSCFVSLMMATCNVKLVCVKYRWKLRKKRKRRPWKSWHALYSTLHPIFFFFLFFFSLVINILTAMLLFSLLWFRMLCNVAQEMWAECCGVRVVLSPTLRFDRIDRFFF